MDSNVHRFHDLLSRVFDVKGHQGGETVIDDIMPVVDIMCGAPEYRQPRDEALFFAMASVGALAGNVSRCLLSAPPGGYMVPTKLRVQSGGAQDLTLAIGTVAPLANLGNAGSLDFRLQRAAVGTPLTYDQAATALTGVVGGLTLTNVTIPASTYVDVPVPDIVLGQDLSLIVSTGVANVTLVCSVFGYYRVAAGAGELRP